MHIKYNTFTYKCSVIYAKKIWHNQNLEDFFFQLILKSTHLAITTLAKQEERYINSTLIFFLINQFKIKSGQEIILFLLIWQFCVNVYINIIFSKVSLFIKYRVPYSTLDWLKKCQTKNLVYFSIGFKDVKHYPNLYLSSFSIIRVYISVRPLRDLKYLYIILHTIV